MRRNVWRTAMLLGFPGALAMAMTGATPGTGSQASSNATTSTTGTPSPSPAPTGTNSASGYINGPTTDPRSIPDGSLGTGSSRTTTDGSLTSGGSRTTTEGSLGTGGSRTTTDGSDVTGTAGTSSGAFPDSMGPPVGTFGSPPATAIENGGTLRPDDKQRRAGSINDESGTEANRNTSQGVKR